MEMYLLSSTFLEIIQVAYKCQTRFTSLPVFLFSKWQQKAPSCCMCNLAKEAKPRTKISFPPRWVCCWTRKSLLLSLGNSTKQEHGACLHDATSCARSQPLIKHDLRVTKLESPTAILISLELESKLCQHRGILFCFHQMFFSKII